MKLSFRNIIENEQVKSFLKDTEQRIQAMSNVHTTLYQGNSLSKITLLI